MTIEERSKKILWLAVYVLWIIGDVEGFWDRWHWFCILLAVGGTCCVAFAEFTAKPASILSIVAVIVGLAIYWYVGPNLPTETEIHGWLLPANEATPPNGCTDMGHPPPAGSILFVAGRNGAWTAAQSKSVVLNVGNSDRLYVERDGQGLAFDADIFDENGILSARIIKNEFHLIPGQYSYQERSADRSKLTVYDKTGREMLYVDYANANSVLVRGLFSTQDGTRVRIDDNAITDLVRNNAFGNMCKGGFEGDRAGITVLPQKMSQ
jgi:hypothetical protein